MKPKLSENALSQGKLGQIRLADFLNNEHPLFRLADQIDWEKFCTEFGILFSDTKGRRALPTRLMVGLSYLKHMFNVSDEAAVDRFISDVYWQYFCGFEYFQHEYPCDPTSLTRWRKRIGEKGAEKLLQESLSLANKLSLLKVKDCEKVIVDTTVQEKNITYPTDAKLLNKVREKLVNLALMEGVSLRQNYNRKFKEFLRKASSYAHARQFNRLNSTLNKMKRRLGCIMRDIERKCPSPSKALQDMISMAFKIKWQEKKSKNKIYSIHEPHVECISKGKARNPYEFGNKVSITTSVKNNWVLGVKSFFGNPFDGSTLKDAIKHTESITGIKVKEIYVDKGYRGKDHHPENAMTLISGRRNLKPALQKNLKRRSSIEPTIGHMKADHRMQRNFLKGKLGDEMNPVLSGAAKNMRKILRSFFLFIFSTNQVKQNQVIEEIIGFYQFLMWITRPNTEVSIS